MAAQQHSYQDSMAAQQHNTQNTITQGGADIQEFWVAGYLRSLANLNSLEKKKQ